EISDVEKGFMVELWNKGLIWDKLLGTLWIPLTTVEYATDEGSGAWWILHSEVIKNGNEICGTKTPTRHEILLDVYFAILNGKLHMNNQVKNEQYETEDTHSFKFMQCPIKYHTVSRLL
ncbi:Protein unc-13 like protein A, partial [Chelonia mydas]